MFTANDESVLVSFQSLCEQYPRENAIALWELAGGQVAAQPGVQQTCGTLTAFTSCSTPEDDSTPEVLSLKQTNHSPVPAATSSAGCND